VAGDGCTAYVVDPPLAELVDELAVDAVEVDDAAVDVAVSLLVSDEDFDSVLDALSPPPLDDEYRSLYQPPPLRWKAERDSSFSMVPALLQAGHAAGAGSLSFCKNSSSFPQAAHRYSKIGIRGT
jgi:hypothetical protein